MTEVKLTCKKCGYKLKIVLVGIFNGKKLKCPKCGGKIFFVEEPIELK